MSLIRLTLLLGTVTSVTLADRWPGNLQQQQQFLPQQINDWVPLHTGGDRSLRFAQFPSQYQSSLVPQQVSYNTPFSKFSFGTQVGPQTQFGVAAAPPAPIAQPLLRNPPDLSQQQLQNVEQDNDVQLVYVPLDQLNQQRLSPQQHNRFNGLAQNVNAALINNFYESVTEPPTAPVTRFAAPITTTTARPVTAASSLSYTATAKPEKLKPYQPPLAIFQINSGKPANLNDVLSQLKAASTIDVLDSPTNDRRPRVFIGPHDMSAPQGYSKFELPYLSSVDWGRTGRKIENLPFFVAPLSYNTPPGFAKIPLPAPHVGSVVVNSPLEKQESKGQGFSANLIQPTLAANRFNFESFNSPSPSPRPSPRPTARPFNQGLQEEFFNTNRRPSQSPSTTRAPATRVFDQTSRPSFNPRPEFAPLPSANFEQQPKPHQQQQQYHEEVTAQPSPSSVSYQTSPKTSSSQFFGFGDSSPSTTASPQTFFSSFGSDSSNNRDPFDQFVHKFKLVDSVKPNTADVAEPDYLSYTNPFGFNSYYTTGAFSQPTRAPARPSSTVEFNRPSSTPAPAFESSTPAEISRPTVARQKPSAAPTFATQTFKPVSEITFETTPPANLYTPTTFLANDGSALDLNGKSPANIHLQNLLTQSQTEYDPYRVAVTEKTRPPQNQYRPRQEVATTPRPRPTEDFTRGNSFG